MSDLISQVSPSVKAIIWVPGSAPKFTDGTYKSVDYILDGLLTAKLKHTDRLESQVLLGTSFGKNLYIFISENVEAKDLKNLKTLISTDLADDSEILVVNESDKKLNLDEWKKELPSKMRVL